MSDESPAAAAQRPVIYQLMVRTFGNTNETRKFNGTLAENGCGKFADINEAALASLSEMGFTHLWLTGVLEQASGTDYPNRPADPPDILKGIAGSPYAIRDYFDVCPDYALDPDQRIVEFRDLLGRCRAHGFTVIIDFVPNHVARSYQSDVEPELSFGAGDDTDQFFHRDNHFYYLQPDDAGGGPPLKMPTAELPGCSGQFAPEAEIGRVTGNNVISWAPSIFDWYETVKLNYGHDFRNGCKTSNLPGVEAMPFEVPKTWRTMDQILAYWQELGVGGFRVDMAHMIPMEFWRWAIHRARARDAEVFFSAEAYNDDPAKLTGGDVLDELLDAGYNGVYDHATYHLIKHVFDAGKWANDLDARASVGERFHRSVRYAENHDEVRIANPHEWGGGGMATGKAVSAVLFAISRGPVMLYHGQEIGEPAISAEGFSGDNGRTSIFDYTSMPAFTKWVNGGRYDGAKLSAEQTALRDWYGRLFHVIANPAFTRGSFYGLNHSNQENPDFGRLDGETVSGHWLYAFLRHEPASGQSFLVVVNLHASETMHNVRVGLPEHAWGYLGRDPAAKWTFHDQLGGKWSGQSTDGGIQFPILPPCEAMMLEITV